MISNGAKTATGNEKLLVEVHPKSAQNIGFESVLYNLGDSTAKEVEMIQIIRVEQCIAIYESKSAMATLKSREHTYSYCWRALIVFLIHLRI